MLRVRVVGSGWDGGPSLNTFYFNPAVQDAATAQLCVARVHGAFTAAAGLYPSNVPHAVSPDVDVLTPANGAITNTFSVDGGTTIAGGAADTSRMAPATALLLRLHTGTFSSGRRIQGRAYMSPLYSQMTDGAGKPTSAAIALGAAFATDLLDSTGELIVPVVWRRERLAVPTHVPPIASRDGMVAPIASVSVNPKFAVLRSRRD